MANNRRALHFVFKISNRKSTIDFYRNILGMKVLRHEEFEKGCEAACNGPYDGKWSKTMVGYGAEDNHFVVELTYNYGIKKYEFGNDFLSLGVSLNNVKSNADKSGYSYQDCGDDSIYLSAPDGYKFIVDSKTKSGDPVTSVSLSVSNLPKSLDYWHGLLGMEIYEQSDKSAILGYSKDQCALRIVAASDPINHAEAFGRIAFACPSDQLKGIEAKMQESKQTILTPYISLDTPGKATVQVVILADPDGHEICFVGDEGFRELSKVDPKADELLDKAIADDKSDEWFARREELKKKQAEK